MFHLRFGLSDHLKALLDFVFGSRRRVKKVRIFRAWFSQYRQAWKSTCSWMCASFATFSWSVTTHHWTDLAAAACWWRKAPSWRSSLLKLARIKVHTTACREPAQASWSRVISLSVGLSIAIAIISGTTHHLVQCPIVLSPHPHTLHTTTWAGWTSQYPGSNWTVGSDNRWLYKHHREKGSMVQGPTH